MSFHHQIFSLPNRSDNKNFFRSNSKNSPKQEFLALPLLNFDKPIKIRDAVSLESSPKNGFLSGNDSVFTNETGVPYKSEAGNLSTFTQKENLRFSIQNSPVFYSNSTDSLKKNNFGMKMPTDQDFKKILNKLEIVSSNKNTGHRRIILHEGDIQEVLLEKGNFQYFTIQVANKACPLIVTLKKTVGNCITFISKHNPEPSKTMSENYSKTGLIQLSDMSPKFRHELGC